MFRNLLQGAIDEAWASGLGFALMFLDLDRFKEIFNDSLGHEVGDQLLPTGRNSANHYLQRGTTRWCKMAQTRPNSAVFRLGGDEFTILVRNVVETEAARAVARYQITPAELPCRSRSDKNSCTSLPPWNLDVPTADGGDGDRLVKQANMAMYRAKSQGHPTPASLASSCSKLPSDPACS
ncbi:MAG: GGDEF domain-containing protein [Rhodoferax sp.]|nr:GGDEF domain-containing protein [Rhodoferax sp.]